MNNPIAVRWLEDATAIVMARIEDRPLAPNTRGTPLVQADIASIVYSVYDITTDGAESVVAGHNAQSLSAASVIFDSLQGWHVDGVGHNFRTTIAATAFPTGGNKYRIEVKVTHVDGRVGHVRWEGPADKIYSS